MADIAGMAATSCGQLVRPVSAPAGTPAEIVNRLNASRRDRILHARIRGKMRALGSEPDPKTPRSSGEFVQAESAAFKRIIDDAKVVLTD